MLFPVCKYNNLEETKKKPLFFMSLLAFFYLKLVFLVCEKKSSLFQLSLPSEVGYKRMFSVAIHAA